MDGYVTSELTTDSSLGSDAFDLWRDQVHANQGGLDSRMNAAHHFDGSMVIQRAHDFQLVEFWSDAVKYVRTDSQARRDDDRSLRVVLPVRGSVYIRTSDQSLSVGPSRLAVFSMAHGVTLSHLSNTRAWIFSLPESAWPNSRTFDATRTIDGKLGVGAVAASMLRELSTQRDELSELDFLTVALQVAQLTAVSAGAAQPHHAELVASIRSFVMAHADDVDLTPASLASALGWSLRQVQASLRTVDTTPSELIRSVRLQNARLRLANPAEASRTIAEIAYRSGFASISGFNGAFRAEFGASPRETRREADPGVRSQRRMDAVRRPR